MSTTETPAKRFGVSWPIMVAAAGVIGLLIFLGYMLMQPGRVASVVPSVLIGRQAPQTPLPMVQGLPAITGEQAPGFDPAQFQGKITVVNFWASWCGPCREEHPYLVAMAEDPRIQVFGVNYKDRPAQAIRFLRQLGSPYAAIGADDNGRTAIEWGVYGMPETFLVGPDGTIVDKHVGPVNAQTLTDKFMPQIERLAATAE